MKSNNRTQLIKLRTTPEIATKIIGFQVQDEEVSAPSTTYNADGTVSDEAMVCLCERVTAKEVRDLIRKGITDMNQIKAITRAGMGPCGYKTCENLMKQLFREEGVPTEEIELNTRRPLYVEVPLGTFAQGEDDE